MNLFLKVQFNVEKKKKRHRLTLLRTPLGPRFSVRAIATVRNNGVGETSLILEELHLCILYIVSRTNCGAVIPYIKSVRTLFTNKTNRDRKEVASPFLVHHNSQGKIGSNTKTIKYGTRKIQVSTVVAQKDHLKRKSECSLFNLSDSDEKKEEINHNLG